MSDADRERWNAEYASGRWDFLSSPMEHPRLSLVAGLLRCPEDSDLLDLGSGPGHLLDWLPAARAAHYVAVDIADEALARVARREPRARTVCTSLARYQPEIRTAGAVIASEVLTYDDDSVTHLARIVSSCRPHQVIVSVLGPHPDKPNWGRGSKRVWNALATLAWKRVRSACLRDEGTGVCWNVVDYDPGR